MPPAPCHSPAPGQPSPAGRGAAARPRLEHVPDEASAGARIAALDGDAEAPTPAGHRAIRAGGRQRLDDRLDDLLPQWLVHKVTGAPALAHTTVPGLAITSSGRKVPSFFGVSGSIR